jgi:hypothetical protein
MTYDTSTERLWKGAIPETRETGQGAAAEANKRAPRMLEQVEGFVRDHGPASPEEVTALFAQRGEKVLLTTVRARMTQLRGLGRVVPSGLKGLGESQRAKVIRWRCASPEELSLFRAQKAAEAEHGENPHD